MFLLCSLLCSTENTASSIFFRFVLLVVSLKKNCLYLRKNFLQFQLQWVVLLGMLLLLQAVNHTLLGLAFRTWNALLQDLLAFKVFIVKLAVILRIFHLHMICVFSLGDFKTFFVLSTQYFTYDLLWGFSNVDSFVSRGFLHATNSHRV